MRARGAWRSYLAADEEYERADRRLRATDYEPAVARALAFGPEGFAALEFLSIHRPLETVHRLLPVLLPMAIEGGSEQGDARALILAADHSAVAQALPALVQRVVDGPAEGDQAYLSYYGLMDLLERLEEKQLLRRVVDAARRSPDPEIHSAADDFDEDLGALDDVAVEHDDVRSGAGALFDPPDPQVPALEAWHDYVGAWSRRNRTRNALLRHARLRARLREYLGTGSPGAARLLAELLGSENYAQEVREALSSLDTGTLRETVSLVAETLLTDHRLRELRYRALLAQLSELSDGAGLAVAVELARTSADPQTRDLAKEG